MIKAIVLIKSMGIGDLCILIGSIHAISRKINEPVTVFAPKSTHAKAILKDDSHVEDVIELDSKEIKGFFNIIKKIKPRNFDQSYIFSDSLRLYLISKLSNNLGATDPTAYMTNAKVYQLGRGASSSSKTSDGNANAVLKEYEFVDIFPTNISAIDLSYDSSDAIEEFTVDFQVQTFSLAGAGGPNG